jgi:hypothetical protein
VTASLDLDNLPTDELVACAWISTIPGFSPSFVATQLPDPANKDGTPADWVATPPYGFVVVTVVGGNEDDWLPVYRPVMQVDCWSTKPGSNKPPWFRANRLAKHISAATRDRHTLNRQLTIAANGVAYPSASVQRAAMLTSPRRMYDDVGDFARYQFDLQLSWIMLSEVIS